MIIAIINRARPNELSIINDNICIRVGGYDDVRAGGEYIHCEVGTEAMVLALLCAMENLSDFDIGELSGESCLGEEEAEQILKALVNGAEILLGEELLSHPDKSLFIYASALATHFKCSIILGAKSYEPLEFSEFIKDTFALDCSESKLPEPIKMQDFDGLVLYACLEDKQDYQISKMAASLANMKKINLSKYLDQNPVINPELKGLFILTKQNDNYPFTLLKE